MAAQNDRQGTGKHPHKSTEEPYSHTRRDQGQSHQGEGRGQHSSQPSSHRGADHSSQGRSTQGRSTQSSSDNADLKRREYRDEKGEVHHHTRTYMEHTAARAISNFRAAGAVVCSRRA